jgi:peptidoglycan hydrolase CwlO-like protein
MIKLGGINFDQKIVIIISGLLTVGVLYWLMCGRGIPDTGSGIDAARTDIQSARGKQQSAIERIGTVESGLDRSATETGRISAGLKDTSGKIAAVEERITKSEGGLKSSAELISEGQRIIGQIRERGKVRN